MRYTHKLFICNIAVIIITLQFAVAQNSESLKKFGEFYQKLIKDNKIAGSSIYIVKDGETVFMNFAGLSSLETSEKISSTSIFHWASITKTFTALAIMQLRDRGLLKLDDKVIDYLPEIKSIHSDFGPIEQITIRHLLTHTAGLRGATWLWKTEDWQPYEPQSWEQLVAMFPYSKLEFAPGSKWDYSNPGIVFLGEIIKRVTTEDYEYYVEKNILKPLEMNSSYFDITPPHLLKNLCQSYWVVNDTLKPAIFNLNTGITVSNGGLSGSPDDMTKYLNFLLGVSKNPDADIVLSHKSLSEMFQNNIEIFSDLPKDITHHFMGLGFFLEEIYGKRIIGHSGHQNGFHTHIYIHPDSGSGYVVAYSSTGKVNSMVDYEIKKYIVRNFFNK